jgi:dTDP-4-amino-4,6-dideoxygalactose transaminase
LTTTRNLPIVDLNTQYQRLKPEIQAAINEVLEQGNFINGKQVPDFMQELAAWSGSAFCIPCANGTDALQLAYMALDLKPGDEVLIPAFNYVAAAEAAVLLNLVPVFCEVDPHTFNLDPESARQMIGPKTKALVAVHLFGQGCHMDPIVALCKEKGLFLIEDNAQAIGAKAIGGAFDGKCLGTIGDIGTTSFFPSKNLGCMGDGGALFCQDEVLAKKIKMLANHGQMVKYQYDFVGINSRLDTVQAAILRVKLGHLDSFIEARRKAASWYDTHLASLSGLSVPVRASWSSHVFHQYTLTFDEADRREIVRKALAEKGIQTMVYYPKALHLHSVYRNGRVPESGLSISEGLCDRVLSLPMHTELDEEMLAYICQSIAAS